MTLREAQYVLEHREMYDDATYHYALEVVESAHRQGIFDRSES
jgi:hypothetical protein